jgi:hypothetical protein
MATLETQYKNYLLENPNSNLTFEEWKIRLGDIISKGIEILEKNEENDKQY